MGSSAIRGGFGLVLCVVEQLSYWSVAVLRDRRASLAISEKNLGTGIIILLVHSQRVAFT